MSDSDSSEEYDELKEIIKEYESKSNQNAPDDADNQQINTNAKVKKEKVYMEVPMDKVLFGDKKGLLKNFAKSIGQEEVDEHENKSKAKKRKPVWTDPNDEEIQVGDRKRETRQSGPLDHLRKDKSYKEYLTTRFSRVAPQPKWASLDNKKTEESSDDEELLHTVGFLAKSANNTLTPTEIDYKRLKNLNNETYAEGPITQIQFHPTSTAALVTGKLGVASIYSIDGNKNEKLHSMYFNNFPILSARIMPCGTKAIFGSVKKYYYKYDLLLAKETICYLSKSLNSTCSKMEISPCGRYIVVVGRYSNYHVLTANSNELIHTFKQENGAVDICFTADSDRLICKDGSSNVFIFSMRQRRLEHKFIDDGCIAGSVIKLSPDQRILATGSMEGIVNVYDFDKVQQAHTPIPEKSFKNLRTAISDIKFNHTSELLAMCSNSVPDAVKLAHLKSGTVYANFPGFQPRLRKINTLQFSPNSGYLALGDTQKKVPLFRLKYFNNY